MRNIKDYEFYYKLRTLPFVDEIALFGSRAKGVSGTRSDIDLAILCPRATEDNWQAIIKIIRDADTLLNIDCVRIDQLEDIRLLNEINHTKQILFKRVINNYSWYETFLDLGESLERFDAALQLKLEDFPYALEATIQIFEYSFELYWKLLKKICTLEGLEANSPRTALQQAYTLKLIDNEQTWLKMIEDRNLTVHTYKHPTALLIYEHCKQYYKIMLDTYLKLKEKFNI